MPKLIVETRRTISKIINYCFKRPLKIPNNLYKFSVLDLKLYEIEKDTKMLFKKATNTESDLKSISIGNHEIFWPNNISDSDLPWLYHEIFDSFENNPSSYDHPAMEYNKAKWIIDAGCCEGYFSVFAFHLNKTCKVIAFEPLEGIKIALRKTFEKEIKDNRFNLLQKALGSREGIVTFQEDSTHICNSLIKDLKNNEEIDLHLSYDIDVVAIDDIALAYELKEDGIIKMDIEGGEINALKGCIELMSKHKPKLAIAVYHGYENAVISKNIILSANPNYKIEFRGMYGYCQPPRPYILFAW